MNISQPKTQDPITKVQIEYMLRDILRIKELYVVAKNLIKVEYFDISTEPHFMVLWKVILDLDSKFTDSVLFGDLNNVRTLVETELQSYLINNPGEIVDQFWPQLFNNDANSPGIIPWIYTYSNQNELNEKQSRFYISRFLSERSVQASLRHAFVDAGKKSIINLPEMLRQHMELDISLKSVNINPVQSLAPENWKPKKLKKFSTGIDFFDRMLSGGQVPGEVYGVLGGYGSGKTMLAVQLVCRSAMEQLRLKAIADSSSSIPYKPKHSYIFHYEASADEIRARMWSHICEIDWTEIQEFDFDNLSSNKGPIFIKEYEKKRWKNELMFDNGNFQAEAERLSLRLPIYNHLIHLVDMSGPAEDPKRGSGYVDEIAQILGTWGPGKGQEIGIVVIDYAGICTKRYLNNNNIGMDQLRHKLGDFGDACRRLIATPFNCPVWVFHQLRADANKRSSANRQHLSDAAEAKNFAENLWFSFEMTIPEEETRCLTISCSKARRARIPKPEILRIDGQFSTMVDASKEFYWDDSQGRFIPIAEAAMFDEDVKDKFKKLQSSAKEAPVFDPFSGESHIPVEDFDPVLDIKNKSKKGSKKGFDPEFQD